MTHENVTPCFGNFKRIRQLQRWQGIFALIMEINSKVSGYVRYGLFSFNSVSQARWPISIDIQAPNNNNNYKLSSYMQNVVKTLAPLGLNETLREKTRWKLHQDAARCLQQHPKEQQLYSHFLPISQFIQVKWARHARHYWWSKDQFIGDFLLWIPAYGPSSVGRPALVNSAMSRHRMPSRWFSVNDGWQGWIARDRQKDKQTESREYMLSVRLYEDNVDDDDLCYRYALMMMTIIWRKFEADTKRNDPTVQNNPYKNHNPSVWIRSGFNTWPIISFNF